MCVGEEFTMVNKKTVTKITNSKTPVSKTVTKSTGKNSGHFHFSVIINIFIICSIVFL